MTMFMDIYARMGESLGTIWVQFFGVEMHWGNGMNEQMPARPVLATNNASRSMTIKLNLMSITYYLDNFQNPQNAWYLRSSFQDNFRVI